MFVTRNDGVLAGDAPRGEGRHRLVVTAARDAPQHPQGLELASIREDRVGRGDLERRCLEDAERDRRVRARLRTHAHEAPEGRHPVEARQFRGVDGRDVARHRERPTEGRRPVVLVLVVTGIPRLLLVVERRRLVGDEGGRRDVAAALGGRPLERREVDERLEHRAGLAPCVHRAVELRLVVRAPAHHGEHLAGARVDGDERGLRVPAPLAAREQVVHPCQALAHAVLRDALQVEVERGVDVDREQCPRRFGYCSASTWLTRSTK
jgi:hypothetical protein